jgi:hypothetical protein
MVKYRDLADETKRIRKMDVQIIPIIVSSLGAVYEKSFEALRALLGGGCLDKTMTIIGRRLSEAAVAGSLEIWRKYSKEMPHPENRRAEQIMRREITLAEDALMNAEGDESEIRINEASQEVNEEFPGEDKEEAIEQMIQDLSEEIDNGENDEDDEDIEHYRSEPRVSKIRDEDEDFL